MLGFLSPPAHQEQIAEQDVDETYKKLRFQVLLGIIIGYAAYYLIRKNFSLAMPNLIEQGFTKSELGFALSAVSFAYGFSKFLMGNLSDRSDARKFMSIGLILSALTMIFMGIAPFATASVTAMFGLLFLNGWFQGMGYPAGSRVMTHWFSVRERGVKWAYWNTSHNLGAGLVGPMAIFAIYLFHDWHSQLWFHGVVALVFAGFTWMLLRDTPQSCGLPSIEEWTGERLKSYDASHEQEMTAKEIFFKYVFNNKLLWYLSLANVFVYLVRYGVLDWAPTYLSEVKGFSMAQSGWAYFLYEFAGIPGILLCGWASDRFFKGCRAPVSICMMVMVSIAIVIYWQNPAGNPLIDNLCLIIVGFFIYGPVVLVGLQAADSAPKKATGTATGLTGLFGYLGGALFANLAMGVIVDVMGWSGGFILILVACFMAILFLTMTMKREREDKAGLFGQG
ncbi:glycerol-3-phosphate transporter [Endozoicomonas sp. OPT23]|uniref:glycerol-3-phosphate transporter n=1 Tax=Endozoicomonas sp. OPT23 TaxID=2072845 RepID=UPI00129AD6EC|nr:glycerol-3-phosphate transporter [Endozoicomonas sp. OPT23]MRI31854.1 glycerol-3-phosphate transporter [Endozoicomonas sp. OPT23]